MVRVESEVSLQHWGIRKLHEPDTNLDCIQKYQVTLFFTNLDCIQKYQVTLFFDGHL